MNNALRTIGVLVLAAVFLAPAMAEDATGEALYNKKCAMCHGKDGVAKKMATGSRNFADPEFQKAVTVDDIVKTSTEGKGKMPKYAEKLTADQLKMVAEYVKTFKE